MVTHGALPKAAFQVNDQGKEVLFSRGNLQYQPSTGTWRFAGHQYDFIGEQSENISKETGWIDMFRWRTGNNLTFFSGKEEDFNSFIDWGINEISNGGNGANRWRTLTREEWEYLLEKGNSLKKCVSINGINGYLLLPLNYNTPDEIDLAQDRFSNTEWQKMEEKGAVFLPAVGQGNKYEVKGIGSFGIYWSSSPYVDDDDGGAWGLVFDCSSSSEGIIEIFGRWRPQSVRLVQDL